MPICCAYVSAYIDLSLWFYWRYSGTCRATCHNLQTVEVDCTLNGRMCVSSSGGNSKEKETNKPQATTTPCRFITSEFSLASCRVKHVCLNKSNSFVKLHHARRTRTSHCCPVHKQGLQRSCLLGCCFEIGGVDEKPWRSVGWSGLQHLRHVPRQRNSVASHFSTSEERQGTRYE